MFCDGTDHLAAGQAICLDYDFRKSLHRQYTDSKTECRAAVEPEQENAKSLPHAAGISLKWRVYLASILI